MIECLLESPFEKQVSKSNYLLSKLSKNIAKLL